MAAKFVRKQAAEGARTPNMRGTGNCASGVVERSIEGPDGRTHRLRVNLAESPVSWLHARGHLSRRQFEAAEAVRADWERAAMGARVTMSWDSAAAPSRQSRATPALMDRTAGQIGARDRLYGALDAAGPGLRDIVWRVACACESLHASEQALGWPARAGKLVLGFALDRVADFYRIR